MSAYDTNLAAELFVLSCLHWIGLTANLTLGHFVALVSFEGRIADSEMPSPRVWIVPFPDVERFRRVYPGGRINASRAALLADGGRFENAWHLIERR
jgi:hypothetical protein